MKVIDYTQSIITMFLSTTIIILFNLFIAYLISFYSFTIAVGWFCFAVGFQFGKWGSANKKEEEFITREEMIREEYEKNKKHIT